MKGKIIFLFILALSVYISGCSTSISLGIKTFNVTNDEGDTLTFYLGAKEEGLSNKLLIMIQGLYYILRNMPSMIHYYLLNLIVDNEG